MPANYVLLEEVTVGATSLSSVTFSSIPQSGYTDLVLKISSRTARTNDGNGDDVKLYFNGDFGSNYSNRTILGTGSSASSENISATTLGVYGITASNSSAANTFGSGEYYIPNYTSSAQKTVSCETVAETFINTAYARLTAGSWTGTAAITSITLQPGTGPTFIENSTFYLYGVAKLGVSPVIAPKAIGGNIIDTDGTYWYHAFLSSGTFTPVSTLSCEYLVIAGGGGGAVSNANGLGMGGGGAGGYRSSVVGQNSGGGAAAESKVNLGSGITFTVTVGAGGRGGISNNSSGNDAANGSNSAIAGSGITTITSLGGGRGGNQSATPTSGGAGGATPGAAAGQTTGAGTSGQGYAGGTSISGNGDGAGSGGGGAGSVGGNGGSGGNGVAGNGGSGVSSNITGSSVTRAGGGGGSVNSGGSGTPTPGTGGSGGGGNGGIAATFATSGTANTGGGGGAGGSDSSFTSPAGAGGSGIVIIRYTVA
jgi:hypothetical protein